MSSCNDSAQTIRLWRPCSHRRGPWVTLLGLLAVALTCSQLPGQVTRRVSVDSSAVEGNAESRMDYAQALSGDGRVVVFWSDATNLVAGDTNGVRDVFVHDRMTGITERISVSSAGNEADDESWGASITPDGRLVGFASNATNLVAGDTNGVRDAFVHDRTNGQTWRVSVGSQGQEADSFSVFASFSGDGRLLTFESMASNLVPNDTNGLWDVFVHDLATGVTERISVDSVGVEGNHNSLRSQLSWDGRFASFYSHATNLVPGDTNGFMDIFRRDRVTGTTVRVSVDSAGGQGDEDSVFSTMSADGNLVAFDSYATNLITGDGNGVRDAFLHDCTSGITTRISLNHDGSEPDRDTWYPCLSADGSRVALQSFSGLLPDDTNRLSDIYLRDLATGEVTRLSVTTFGVKPDERSGQTSLSADGRQTAYYSWATNLVPGDTNQEVDVFVSGEQLTLDLSSVQPAADELVTATAYEGAPGDLCATFLVDLDGVPFVLLMDLGRHDARGTHAFTRKVDAGLSGMTLTVRAYTFGLAGGVVWSQDVAVAVR